MLPTHPPEEGGQSDSHIDFSVLTSGVSFQVRGEDPQAPWGGETGRVGDV